MVATSTDFVFPPTDGSVPPALAVDFHLKYNPNHLWSVLYNINDSSETNVTYEQLAHAVHRAAHILNPGGKLPQGTQIGLLVSTHTIQYVVLILGAMRAGLVPFPISPRTHVPGIAHLLASTQTSLLVTGGSESIADVTLQLARDLSEMEFHVQFLEMPPLESVLPQLCKSRIQSEYRASPPLKPITAETTLCMLHSSGSTGMPRPVKLHLEGIFKNFINQPFGWLYAGGTRFGTMALPTFHAMGMFLQVMMPLYAGYTQVMFAPGRIPVIPTPDLTIKAGIGARCEYMMCVPAFLEAWSVDKNAVSQLRRMKGIMFGGGPLAETVGNKLHDQGVRIHCCYGATEVGHVHKIWDLEGPSDWGYIKFSPHVDARFIPQNDADNTFEVVFVVTDDHKPFVLNYELGGKLAYKTKDLVVGHPSKPDLWKIFGRLDDQIVLLNGEKTNPGPMEAEIVKCPIVKSAIMFGRERNQTGVLVEFEESSRDLCRTNQGGIKALEEIWPFVERANRASPSHSRIAKEAVLFVDPARPFPRTPKGGVSRSAALKLYARDIQEIYLELETESMVTSSSSSPGLYSSPENMEEWLKTCVQNLLGRKIDVSEDLFQQGMDSLTATMLLRTLKRTLSIASKINQRIIFAKPTVTQLAQVLAQLSSNNDDTADSTTEALQDIRAMIQKYDTGRSQPLANYRQPAKERVVVTGTTGGLGSHLLAQLLKSDRVEKVWAMNRKSSKENKERQTASFQDKLLDVNLLKSGKLVFVDVDLEDSRLALNKEMYDEIRSGVTVIIHNAWQVNFNLSLQSFEPSIRGVHNLLDLAFQSTAPTGSPLFVFASSIAVAGFARSGSCLIEAPVTLEDGATSIGYGQSKLVAEKLLESASRVGLRTCVIRLGQLTGDAISGSWSTTDWVPSLVGSSVSIGCLPGAIGTVSWLPLDVAAHSIIDTCVDYSGEIPPVVHAAHPHPVPWMDILATLSVVLAARTGSHLPIVPFDEWNKRVTQAVESFNGLEYERFGRFPSAKIQSTVDGMVRADLELRKCRDASDAESGGTVRLDTSAAEVLSKTLRSTPELGIGHVGKWVGYWESMGLFKAT